MFVGTFRAPLAGSLFTSFCPWARETAARHTRMMRRVFRLYWMFMGLAFLAGFLD